MREVSGEVVKRFTLYCKAQQQNCIVDSKTDRQTGRQAGRQAGRQTELRVGQGTSKPLATTNLVSLQLCKTFALSFPWTS